MPAQVGIHYAADLSADEAEAKNAGTWTTTVNSVTVLTDDEKRRVLADKVEAFQKQEGSSYSPARK